MALKGTFCEDRQPKNIENLCKEQYQEDRGGILHKEKGTLT